MGKKDQPEEFSFKKKVSRFRTVIPDEILHRSCKKARDPRFDTLSGTLKENHLKQTYSFIKDYQAKEKESLIEAIKTEQCTETKRKIKSVLDRIQSQERSELLQAQRQKVKSERRKVEQELVAAGKNPYFLKKSEQRKEMLVDQFYKMKEKNPSLDIDKLTQKRRKKQASQQKSTLPFRARNDAERN